MQVPELQKALKERGLDSKGLKAVLVERLKAALDIHKEILLEAQIGRQTKLPLSAAMKSYFAAATKKVSLKPARNSPCS
jgi:hypothetical protein